MSASEKWPGFVLTKEGEEFVQTNANYLTYDLCYNPLRYESWLKLAKILDEVQQFSVCLIVSLSDSCNLTRLVRFSSNCKYRCSHVRSCQAVF